jgi:hypothetical protein
VENEEEVSLFDESENLEKEVTSTAPQKKEEPSFEIPEKFTGKSMEDVIKSYVHLEKEFGNKNNEVGELRKLTDQILKNQVESQAPQYGDRDSYVNNDLDFDDFVTDPRSAVDRALQTNPRIQKLEEELRNREIEVSRNALKARHQDVDDIVQSSNFQSWVNEQQGRQRMLQEAHQNLDTGLAADLLDMYKATRRAATDQAIEERDERAKGDLRKATVETGSAPANTKKIYRRAELIQLKIRDPERYNAMSSEIHKAYAEGRVK